MNLILKYIGTIIFLVVFSNMNSFGQGLFFSSPQESVELTSKLLIEENWRKLKKYYFLQDVDKEAITSLKNGSYFIRGKKPEVYHPAVDWRYHKPFPPSYKYLSHIEVGIDSIKVEVFIEIDQGNEMTQRGLTTFYLRTSEKGYQLLF